MHKTLVWYVINLAQVGCDAVRVGGDTMSVSVGNVEGSEDLCMVKRVASDGLCCGKAELVTNSIIMYVLEE